MYRAEQDAALPRAGSRGSGATFGNRRPSGDGDPWIPPGIANAKKSGLNRRLSQLTTEVESLSVVIEIGGIPVRLKTTDAGFLRLLQNRYSGYVSSSGWPEIEFDVDLASPATSDPDADVRVTNRQGRWTLTRGDFHAEWEP